MKKYKLYGVSLGIIIILALLFNGCQSIDIIKAQRENYLKQQHNKELNKKLKKLNLNKIMFATSKIYVYDKPNKKKIIKILNKYDKVIILDIDEKTHMLRINSGYISNKNLTKKQIMCDLVIKTNVKNPTIKIVELNRPYKIHMKLKKGKYTIKIVKEGYYNKILKINLNSDMNKYIRLEKKVFNPNKDIRKVFFSDTSKLLLQPEFYYGQGDALYEAFLDNVVLIASPFKMPEIKKRFKDTVIKKETEFANRSKRVFERKYTKYIHIKNVPLMTEDNYKNMYWSLGKIGDISTKDEFYDRKIFEKILGLDKFKFKYTYEEYNAPIVISQEIKEYKFRFKLPVNKAIEMYKKTKGKWDLWIVFVPHISLVPNVRMYNDQIVENFVIDWEISKIIEKNSGFIFEYYLACSSRNIGFRLINKNN